MARSKLALGTAQFGMDYGINNPEGRKSEKEVRDILRHARNEGVNCLDTAIAYGSSEQVLGRCGAQGFGVITKLSGLPQGQKDVYGYVNMQVMNSLDRLRLDSVDAILLHRPNQLLESCGDKLYRSICRLKSDGFVGAIGISIYSPEDLHLLLKHFDIDLVQAPYNLIDRRMDSGDWFKILSEKGVRVHLRSIFLQGLLMMDRKTRPARFNTWSHIWEAVDEWCRVSGQTRLEACLRYPLSIPEVEKVIVGVNSVANLSEILQVCDLSEKAIEPPINLSTSDLNLIDPSCWFAS